MGHNKRRSSANDDDERPTKKVAFETSPARVKVSFISDAAEWNPVIASSPGLSLDRSLAFDGYVKPRRKPRHHVTHEGTAASAELLLQSSSHPRLDHIAREEECSGSSSTGELLKHYIGIYDAATGRLELMPARSMVVRGYVRQTEAEKRTAELEKNKQPDGEVGLTGRAALTSTFGTKKSRAAISALTTNAIRNNAADGDGSASSLSKALLSTLPATAPSAETLAAAIDESRPIPPHNVEATTLADAYPINGILPRTVASLLPVTDWMTAVEGKKAISTPSRFVSHHLDAIVRSKSTTRIRLLRYTLALILFHNALRTSRGGHRIPKPVELKGVLRPYVPDTILPHLTEQFADPSAPSIVPPARYVLLVTTILVCTLHLDDFATSTADIIKDLQFSIQKTTRFFMELGCKLSNISESDKQRLGLPKGDNSVKIAKLQVPLKFPSISRGPRR